jgi:hypothetical protein
MLDAPKCLEGQRKMMILSRFFSDPVLRFSDLKCPIPAVSQKMLIQQSRDLARTAAFEKCRSRCERLGWARRRHDQSGPIPPVRRSIQALPHASLRSRERSTIVAVNFLICVYLVYPDWR